MADCKEKIRKLLALAGSSNEHEAKAALLKARELMAEHKLSETELEDVKKQEVKNIRTNISFSKRRDPWILRLAAVISNAYCCRMYRSHVKGKQTQTICIAGLEEDADICVSVFEYAVDCIRSGVKAVKSSCPAGMAAEDVQMMCNGYGCGFVKGIEEAFANQEKESNEEGWGLVMVCPQEVNDFINGFCENHPFQVKGTLDKKSYDKGLEDGKNWNPNRRVAAQ